MVFLCPFLRQEGERLKTQDKVLDAVIAALLVFASVLVNEKNKDEKEEEIDYGSKR